MKVFIGFYGGGHVTAAIPIIRELERRGHEVVALALTAAAATMARQNIGHKLITDYVDPQETTIRRFGMELAERHHTDGKGITREASIAYLGTAMADLAAEIGEEAARERYGEHGLNAFMPIRTARRILEQERPDCVIATASPRMEAALLRAAEQMGIPSVCVIDLFAILELPWLRDPGHARVLTVYSERAKARLVEAGREPASIVVTGNPAFDSLAEPTLPARSAQWRAAKGISDAVVTLLWAEQPEPGNIELPRSIRARLAEICARNGWLLVVRLHPASMDPRVEIIPAGAVQSHADEALPEVAKGVEIVVTMTSTVAMEGLLLNKPVITIGGSQYDHLVDYSVADGAFAVGSVDAVEDAVREIVSDGPFARQLAEARRGLPQVGGASQRVVDVVEEVVRSKP